ncbi:hypothetical protein VTH82DRAFT_2600 [Thermothelomyces myriococcoides]
MPIRIPFARRTGVVQDENQRPGSTAGSITTAGFERVDTVGSKASSIISIRSSRRSYDTGEYKLSVVNDSGVYLPPSPVEREASWPRRYLSRGSSGRNSSYSRRDSDEIDQFPISRESFDSYRRSFDICARSPVVHPTTTAANAAVTARQSLDSATFRPTRLPSRSPLNDDQQERYARRPWRGQPTPEEETGGSDGASFEDVGLGDPDHGRSANASSSSSSTSNARKRGLFFGRFGVIGGGENGGRKRAQSGGQAAELGVMPSVSRLDGSSAATATPPAGLEGMQAKEVEA